VLKGRGGKGRRAREGPPLFASYGCFLRRARRKRVRGRTGLPFEHLKCSKGKDSKGKGPKVERGKVARRSKGQGAKCLITGVLLFFRK